MCITGHCMTMYVLNGFGILGTCTGELESKDFVPIVLMYNIWHI